MELCFTKKIVFMVFFCIYINYVKGRCDQHIITPLSLLIISCWPGNTLELNNRHAGNHSTCHLPAFWPCETW